MPSLNLQDLAVRHRLPPGAVPALETLLDRLSEPTAPTAVHEASRVLEIHIADSLAGLELPEVREARILADLGAGGGPPGLVLAAALPNAQVVLVESVARKCAFMRRTAEAMGLANVEVVNARAEEWAAGKARCDVVCARALAALPVVCEYAAPLLADGGMLVAWKGAVDATEAADAAAAAHQLGLSPARVLAVAPYPGSEQRTLHVFRKIAATPSRFPRRAGMATKRPLTAPRPR